MDEVIASLQVCTSVVFIGLQNNIKQEIVRTLHFIFE